MAVSLRLVLSISRDKRFFTRENALRKIIYRMLRLYSPNLGHFPLLIFSAWHIVVFRYEVAKHFDVMVLLHMKHTKTLTSWCTKHESSRWSIFTRLSCQRFRFFVRFSHQGRSVDRADQKRLQSHRSGDASLWLLYQDSPSYRLDVQLGFFYTTPPPRLSRSLLTDMKPGILIQWSKM